MSNGNFWDESDNEEISEYSLLEEAEETEDQAEANYYDSEDIEEEILEDIEQGSAFDLDDRETAVIYNARLRLEQAKLYEMLINHNLFEGVDASPRAIKNVQNELKEYIVERLEILMGMRKEKAVAIPEEIEVSVESEFNDVEKDFLKQLAYKGTMGNSAKGVIERRTQTIKPVTQSTSSGLKPLVRKEIVREEQPVRRQVVSKPPQKKVATKKPKKTATVPSKKNSVKNTGNVPRKLSQAEIEQLAKEDLERDVAILKNNGKSWKKLSPEEKARRLAQNNRSLTNKGKIPTPTQEQINAHYEMKVHNRIGGNESSQFNTMLASAIAMQKSKQGE